MLLGNSCWRGGSLAQTAFAVANDAETEGAGAGHKVR